MAKIFICFLLICFSELKAQEASPEIYDVDRVRDAIIGLGGFWSNHFGQETLVDKGRLDAATIAALDPMDVNAFDRGAIFQDTAFFETADDISDWGMNIAAIFPAALAINKKYRQDWLDLLLIYIQAQALNSNLYVISATNTNRIRPRVYNPDVAMKYKTALRTKDSFFSGHVSAMSTATFFMAKVINDYNPGLERKDKILLFGIAGVPPLLNSVLRYKAGKHFPTDIIVGYGVGVLAGVLVPELHRIKDKDTHAELKLNPSGVAFTYKF